MLFVHVFVLSQQTASSRASLLGTETLSTPRHRAHTSTSASNLGPSSSTRFELLSSETAESPFSYRPNNPTANHEGDLRNAYSRREELFIDETDSKLDALIQQGQEIWGSLADQKGWLKGTRRKVLDAANGIKGGREVIGWVERRRLVFDSCSAKEISRAAGIDPSSVCDEAHRIAGYSHLERLSLSPPSVSSGGFSDERIEMRSAARCHVMNSRL